MIDLYVMMCLIDEPTHCKSKRYSTSYKTVAECSVRSMGALVDIINANPNYSIKKFSCSTQKLEAAI